jgi:hypothetical protein
MGKCVSAFAISAEIGPGLSPDLDIEYEDLGYAK